MCFTFESRVAGVFFARTGISFLTCFTTIYHPVPSDWDPLRGLPNPFCLSKGCPPKAPAPYSRCL